MNVFLWLWMASVAAQTAIFALAFCLGLPRFRALARPLPPGDPKEAQPLPVALIIPMAGRGPDMEEALDSLLKQDYPLLRVYLTTHGEKDPARELARELAARHPRVRHVEAGPAEHCGQKNKNLLDSLDAVEPDTAVYVFCDANHRAGPDFVRELVRPILQGRADFCTGYRRTRLCGGGVYAAACHALNRLMLLLESLPVFTQPWGGATAVSAAAFRDLDVRGLWSRTVVDDCSLAGLLKRRGVPVLFRPTALLDTPVRSTAKEKLEAWYFRQLAYPKFYTFGPWLLIGIVPLWVGAALAVAASIAAVGLFDAFAGGLSGGLAADAGGFLAPSRLPQLTAFAYLFGLLVLQGLLRRRIAPSCSRGVWLAGLLFALWTTLVTYAHTMPAREMVWHGLRYRLSADGRVLDVERLEKG